MFEKSRIQLLIGTVVASLTASAVMMPAAAAPTETVPETAGTRPGLGAADLRAGLAAVHRAGMPGVYAEVRAAEQVWRGASGVADVRTGRPVLPHLRHRVGSVTKAFTAAAILQQVERGKLELDAPISAYLPRLVPGERGTKITVRMLLNHTSGIPDYLPSAFPSLEKFPSWPDMSTKSLDDNRFRRFHPVELIKMGLAAPPVGEPGAPTGEYSNTNYLILGQLLEHVSGTTAERYMAENIIEPAGLRHTYFPARPLLNGPHSRMYESFHGLSDPPRDYSVYDMSWAGTGASLVSTMADVNRFFAALLGGRIVKPSSLAQMQRTIPVQRFGQPITYGLGLLKLEIPGCGTFWGHDGTVWGAETVSWIRADGRRQLSVGMNLTRWNKPDSSGNLQPHPIDDALSAFYQRALCDRRSG